MKSVTVSLWQSATTLALYHSVTVALWHYGTMALICHCVTVALLWHCGTVALWHYSVTLSLCHYSVNMTSYYLNTIACWCGTGVALVWYGTLSVTCIHVDKTPLLSLILRYVLPHTVRIFKITPLHYSTIML